MTLKKMEEILEAGYDINIVALLYIYKEGGMTGSMNEKIAGYVGMMERKGLLIGGRITGAGEELLEMYEGGVTVTKEEKKQKNLEEIFDKVQERLIALTGKRQIRTDIFGKAYNYLPSKYDFITRLKGVVNKYKLKDLEKIEKILINVIEKCHKTGKWFPLMVYYMTKNEVSTLASDYEGWEEQTEQLKQEYDGTNI